MAQMIYVSPLKKQKTISSPMKDRDSPVKTSLLIQNSDILIAEKSNVNVKSTTPKAGLLTEQNTNNNINFSKPQNEIESPAINPRIDHYGTPIIKTKKKKKYKAVFRDDVKKGPLEDIIPIKKNIIIENMTFLESTKQQESEVMKPLIKSLSDNGKRKIDDNCSCTCIIF